MSIVEHRAGPPIVEGRAIPILEDLTVVIPTMGRPILEKCLERIAAGSRWPARVIVVDQSGSADIAAVVERFRSIGLVAEHLSSSQRGKSAAVNRGFERATTRFVAVTDDDCLAEHDWLETMAKRLVEHPNAVVTGPAHATGDETPVSVVTVSAPAVSRRPGLRFDLFCGSNMGIDRAVMERVGFFDEAPCFLAAAEDCDWAYRALRAGVPIVYAPDVVVHHFGWRSADERHDRYQRYARSHGSFYGKHLRQGDMLIFLRAVIHCVRAFKRWLTGTLTGNREQMLNGRAYLTGLLPGIVDGLRRRPTT